MKLCEHCGSPVESDVGPCPVCGKEQDIAVDVEENVGQEDAPQAVSGIELEMPVAPVALAEAEVEVPTAAAPEHPLQQNAGTISPGGQNTWQQPQPPVVPFSPYGSQGNMQGQPPPLQGGGAYPSGAQPYPVAPQAVEPLSFEQMEDARKNRDMAILAYLGIMVIVPLISAQKSPFVRFHINQGVIITIVSHILGMVVSFGAAFSGGLALLFFLPLYAVQIFLLVVFIMGISSAYQGKMQSLPIIGKFQLLK